MDTSIKETQSETSDNGFAKRLHPEDISVGDAILVSETQYEIPSFLWCGADTFALPPESPVRISLKACPNQAPLKVKAICLPYILCRDSKRRARLLDVRQVQLMKLARSFSDSFRKALKEERKKSKKVRRRKKSK